MKVLRSIYIINAFLCLCPLVIKGVYKSSMNVLGISVLGFMICIYTYFRYIKGQVYYNTRIDTILSIFLTVMILSSWCCIFIIKD